MARQTGIITIQGSLGGVVFKRDGIVAQKPPSNRERFRTAPSMARTRENAEEFGRAARYSKLLRAALAGPIAAAGGGRVAGRVTRLMRELIGLDDVRPRGERGIDPANSAPLRGFRLLGRGRDVGQVLRADYEVASAGTELTLRLPRLHPATDLASPPGATHYELLFGAAALDLTTHTFRAAVVAEPPGIRPLAEAARHELTVVARFAAPLPAGGLVVGVVGVSFYQEVAGQPCPLRDKTANALAIEYVSQSGF